MSLTTQQRELLAAAFAGQRRLMDEAELAAIAFLVHPHDAHGRPWFPPEMDDLVLWPTELMRMWGPRAVLAVEWSLVIPCGRCWRTMSRRKACRKCGGAGHLADCPHFACVTDIDGLILEDADGDRV